MLRNLRKQAGLTQADVASRLGVTQQTLSALERNAEKVGIERLLRLLSILNVGLVLRQAEDASTDSDAPSAANRNR
ncbi:hypothetical protein A9973_27300 [Achromobacter sp. UMC46]|nr:hypothetical protein [Achromobacter sp. UMC46]